ncbi:HECT-type E3 ubiquitin transferase [Aphelenchoides fujianensis]|nr:HECT-type E3 ubiquitin transferase [Aphelenchoides fujianensis]
MDFLNLDERQKFVEKSQREREERETEFVEKFGGNEPKPVANTELLRRGSFAFHHLIQRAEKCDLQVELPARLFVLLLLEILVRALVQSIESSSTATSFAALFLSAQHIQPATALISDLFRFRARPAGRLQSANKLLGEDGLRSDSISRPAALGHGLKGKKTLLPNEQNNVLFTVIFRILGRHSWDDEAILRFVRHVLTAPALIVALNPASLQLLKAEGIFQRTIGCLVANRNAVFQPSGMLTLNLTANFIHLSFIEQQAVIENLHDWTVAVSSVLSKCQSSANSGVPHGHNNYHHPILGWISEKIDDDTQGTFDRVGRQLEYLWSRKLINCLFGQVLSCFELPAVSKKKAANSEEGLLPAELMQKLLKRLALKENDTSGAKDRPPNVGAVVCGLYQQVLLLFHDYKMSILNSICCDDRILVQLWNFVIDPTAGGLENYVRLLAVDPLVTSPNFAPLHLFADAAQSLIQILDEKEMYESGSPFTIEKLRDIARFTNLFCFKCIWENLIDFEQMKPKALFESVYKLCSILYTRDCRRSFTMNPSFWIVTDVKPSNVIAEFERKQPRARHLLQHMPHVIPLRERMVLFRKLIAKEKESLAGACTVITVERSRIVEDGFRQLADVNPRSMRATIRVKFINQQGLDEAGIDQDGVFKEFLEQILQKCTSNNLLYPSNTSSIQENHLKLFYFRARPGEDCCVLAVYEGICIDVQLAPVLLAAVLRKKFCPFDELAVLDPELYRNLTTAKEDVADLELTFAYTEESLGKIQTVELKPGGSHIRVTNENKISYIHQMAQFRVVGQTKEQSACFVQGFQSIINSQWLALFSTHELQHVISGQTSDVDIDDLRKHTQYYGGFHSNHRVIKWLWSILERDFTPEERHFIWSPRSSIRCVDDTPDDMDQGDTLGSVIRGFLAIKRKHSMTRLPTASTCFNLLKLPNYSKKSVLLEKLRYAIHSETGFELS